jgi:predicted membrane metal-binding protein
MMGWRKTAVLGLGEAVIVTLSAQLMTLPLIIYYFSQISLVSVLANALIMPLHPLTLISGGAATLLAQIIPALGQLVGWLAWLFLTYTVGVVNLLAAVPGAALPVQLPVAGVLALYGSDWGGDLVRPFTRPTAQPTSQPVKPKRCPQLSPRWA